MSRAFVREEDFETPEALPERPISEHRNLVTESGLKQIEAQIDDLQARLAQADDSEKPFITRDLRYWQARRETAELVMSPGDCAQVRFGCWVTIEDEEGKQSRFRIVGEDEADPTQGLIFYRAPLARLLIGKRGGEEAEFRGHQYEIIEIGLSKSMA